MVNKNRKTRAKKLISYGLTNNIDENRKIIKNITN